MNHILTAQLQWVLDAHTNADQRMKLDPSLNTALSVAHDVAEAREVLMSLIPDLIIALKG